LPVISCHIHIKEDLTGIIPTFKYELEFIIKEKNYENTKGLSNWGRDPKKRSLTDALCTVFLLR
jgi:hypothetical protein